MTVFVFLPKFTQAENTCFLPQNSFTSSFHNQVNHSLPKFRNHEPYAMSDIVRERFFQIFILGMKHNAFFCLKILSTLV